jgi:hypothetical protein
LHQFLYLRKVLSYINFKNTKFSGTSGTVYEQHQKILLKAVGTIGNHQGKVIVYRLSYKLVDSSGVADCPVWMLAHSQQFTCRSSGLMSQP